MYAVFNIGCIECGVSSNIVGLFFDKMKADQVAEHCYKNFHWRENGQNHFQVFELPQPEVIHPEYRKE